MKNPVTWFEIIGTDAASLHRFYGDVFGWKLTPPAPAEMGSYAMLAEHGPGQHGAGGGIGAGPAARISVYVEVDDPQIYVEKATRSGARVLMPVTEIVPGTTIAMLADPAGNTFGLMKASPRPAKTTRKKTTARRATGARKKTATRRTTARKTTRRPRRRR